MSRVAGIVVAAMLVAGCSNSDDAIGTTSTAATTTTTTTTTIATTTTTSLAGPPTTAVSQPLPPSPIPPRTIDELLALGRPIVLAHSGGEDAFPSETMYGFVESAEAGVDMLDLNLQLSADGVLMTFHDSTVDRTTDGSGPINELTVAEIQALDAAYWFTPTCGACTDRPEGDYVFRGARTGEVPPPDGYSPADFRVPTLQDVVVRFPEAPLNVEIKGDDEQGVLTAIALSTFITDNPGVRDRMVVSSFNDAALARFIELQPDVEVSPALDAAAGWVLSRTPLPAGMRILQLPPSFEGTEVITAQLVADSAAAGYPIWVWPNDRDLENLASYRAFLDLGVAGLNINQPAYGVAAVQQFVAG